MIEQFRPMKPKKVDTIPVEDERFIYQQKIDGGNAIIDVELPKVTIIHAGVRRGNELAWNKRTYRYPELVKEIREGVVLKDDCAYIGELTVLDEYDTGRAWLFLKRQLESNFQIQRMSKLLPVVYNPHHIIREGDDELFDMPYMDILKMLEHNVKKGNHVQPIPCFDKPDKLLEKKGLIEGIVAKDRYGTYHKGKRVGWFKQKFLKEKTVKFVSFEEQEIGIKLFTDDNKPIHLAGQRVELAIQEIKENGHVIGEIEYYAETSKGFRDCSLKRLIPTLTENKFVEDL